MKKLHALQCGVCLTQGVGYRSKSDCGCVCFPVVPHPPTFDFSSYFGHHTLQNKPKTIERRRFFFKLDFAIVSLAVV